MSAEAKAAPTSRSPLEAEPKSRSDFGGGQRRRRKNPSPKRQGRFDPPSRGGWERARLRLASRAPDRGAEGRRSRGRRRFRSARTHRQGRCRSREARRGESRCQDAPDAVSLMPAQPASHRRVVAPLPDARAYLQAGRLRRDSARFDAQGDRQAADVVEDAHPAFLSDHRLQYRRAAGHARAAERGGREGRLQALGQRFRREGVGAGADARAGGECKLDRHRDPAPQARRCRRRGRARFRAHHAHRLPRRGEGPRRHLQRGEVARRTRPREEA